MPPLSLQLGRFVRFEETGMRSAGKVGDNS